MLCSLRDELAELSDLVKLIYKCSPSTGFRMLSFWSISLKHPSLCEIRESVLIVFRVRNSSGLFLNRSSSLIHVRCTMSLLAINYYINKLALPTVSRHIQILNEPRSSKWEMMPATRALDSSENLQIRLLPFRLFARGLVKSILVSSSTRKPGGFPLFLEW